MDIFIINIKTEYTINELYAEDKKLDRHKEIEGYTVKFLLNDDIRCELRIKGNDTGGCGERIKEYIKDKIVCH